MEDMNIGDLLPIMIYDDMCYLCAKFAKVVSVLGRKKILVVGHYSQYGMEIKSEIFPKGYDPTKMFWFVTRKVAYGGRSAILPLLLAILSNKPKGRVLHGIQTACSNDCKTPKAVFARTKSLLSNSEKIILNF